MMQRATATLIQFLLGAAPGVCRPLTGSASSLPTVASDDALAGLPLAEVAAWYLRLAEHVRGIRPTSVSAALLEHYIQGNGQAYALDPDHVRSEPWMVSYLLQTVRPVVLSEKPAPHNNAIVGVLPRVRGDAPHGPWNGSPLQLHYTGPSVEILPKAELAALQAKIWLGQEVDLSDPAIDLFMALGTGFGVRNDLTIAVDDLGGATYRARILTWQCKLFDCYDWDVNKHLSMPNPDFGNPSGVDRPVRPAAERLRVYHRNAFRLEYAGMAHRFEVDSVWRAEQPALLAPREFTV
jgi:hypothetical protein